MTLAARYMTSLRTVLTRQAGSPVSISFVVLGALPYFRTKRFVRFLFPEFLRWTCDVHLAVAIAGAVFRLSLIFILGFFIGVAVISFSGLLHCNFRFIARAPQMLENKQV
jgi:hypothetical protein